MVVTDVSPQGCGGVLLVREGAEWKIVEAYEYAVDDGDTLLLGFQLMSHKSQAYLEAFAIFLALKTWATVLAAIPVNLGIRSDSTVALAIVEKASASTPALNSLAGEITLLLEGLKVSEGHLPGKLNKVADYLSRPQTRGELPKELADIKYRNPRKLSLKDFSLPLSGPASHEATSNVAGAWPAVKG